MMTKPTDKDELAEFEAVEARAQRVILDGVKDHLLPHLAKKKIAYDMWDALKQLFEAKNENQKMALKDKLHNVKMTQGEGVTSYLTRMAQVKDELTSVGETISDSEMARTTLKGFTKRWDVFVKCIVGKEKLLDWSRLWDEFTQEEIREGALGGQVSEEMDQNVSLATKSKNKKKKDQSQIKCYHSGQLGHCHKMS